VNLEVLICLTENCVENVDKHFEEYILIRDNGLNSGIPKPEHTKIKIAYAEKLKE